MKEENKDKIFSARSMAFMALFAALMCVMSPVSLPIGAVPISLGTFAVYLCGAFLGRDRGLWTVVVYILLGAVGLPVFTGFTGGFAKLLGVTGGYIVGYIPMILIIGIFSDKSPKLLPLGMVLATLALYTFGTAWFMISTGSGLLQSLMLCVVPFLIGDGIKIAASCALAIPLKPRINRLIKREK